MICVIIYSSIIFYFLLKFLSDLTKEPCSALYMNISNCMKITYAICLSFCLTEPAPNQLHSPLCA